MGPPPAPAWTMPKPIQLNMTGCPGNCSVTDAGLPKTEHTFTISAANKTISGVVKDASGTTIANAMIFAFSPSQGSGTQGQSDTSGKFSLNVTEGSYNVGAFFPGMGQSRELSRGSHHPPLPTMFSWTAPRLRPPARPAPIR